MGELPRGNWPLPEQHALIGKVRSEYDPDLRGLSSTEPYATVMAAYPFYLRGPILAAILLVGGLGALLRRRTAVLPWLAAVFLLVAPVAVLDFGHRYVLPAVPLACLAAALTVPDLAAAVRRRLAGAARKAVHKGARFSGPGTRGGRGPGGVL
ncbi:hypothetical protein ACFQYP_19125 [Nonomuraea antimicrobica]